MTTTEKPAPCYREATNGVHFTRNAHRQDCADGDCRGCKTCSGTHCSARKNCTWHVNPGELTCGSCMAGVRRDLRWIGDMSALMFTQAIADGQDSEAANLAGPGAYYPKFSARRRIAKRWIEDRLPDEHWEAAQKALLDDDDEHHPAVVLTRWEAMIREDYRHSTSAITLNTALGYLDRMLHRIANDDEQDFPLLLRELKKCRQHLEAVIHNDTKPERAAPCPKCRESGQFVRLNREYAHWCDAEDCQRFHFLDMSGDTWHCPRDAKHWWSAEGYADLLKERMGA